MHVCAYTCMCVLVCVCVCTYTCMHACKLEWVLVPWIDPNSLCMLGKFFCCLDTSPVFPNVLSVTISQFVNTESKLLSHFTEVEKEGFCQGSHTLQNLNPFLESRTFPHCIQSLQTGPSNRVFNPFNIIFQGALFFLHNEVEYF